MATSLPTSAEMISSTQTNAEQKVDLAALVDYVNEHLGTGTTTGTAVAYLLTPTQAITAYSAGQSYFVTFHAAPGVSPTLTISGVTTPPNLVRQDADGSYVNIAANDFPINHRSRVTLLSATQALVEKMPPVPRGARCDVYLATDQVMATTNTFYKVQFATENYDTFSEFNTGTFEFTAKEAGKYRISATASMALGLAGDWGEVAIYLGLTRMRTVRSSTADSSAARVSVAINAALVLAVGDVVSIHAKFNSATASRSIEGTGLSGERSFMSIDRIG